MRPTESIVEDAALTWFGELGYSCLGAEALAQAERDSYVEVVLVKRLLRWALRQIRPKIPDEARKEALRNVLWTDSPSMVSTNTHQCRVLASLGDTLQPERLSGELGLDAF